MYGMFWPDIVRLGLKKPLGCLQKGRDRHFTILVFHCGPIKKFFSLVAVLGIFLMNWQLELHHQQIGEGVKDPV